ncbi:Glomulin/ALF4 [Gracilaria domingensis]|nr:Glomulin/ALF4 [Gracilaria domingensis]
MEDGYDLKQQEDGSYEMRRQDHRLHVGTGQEAEQQWPDVQQPEEAMPVLDLAEAWSKLSTGEELPSVIKREDDIISYNAKVMTAELKYHILASTKNTKPATEVDSAVIEENGDIGHPENSEAEPKPGDSEEGEPKIEKEENESQSGANLAHPKSVYGASILLKLQWEDKKPQKKVPHRTYEELGEFIGDIFKNLNETLQQNELAGEAVANEMAFDLTPLILARYMDGIETCTDVLAENAFHLLTLFVERGSPREMHLAIKTLLKRIDIVYLEASSYLLLKPLMTLWMKLIIRMPRMRHKFVRDLLKEFDRMLSNAETYDVSFVPDEGGIGIEEEGRIKGMSEMILQFLEDLTKLQIKQSEESEAINVEVDALGRAKKRATQATETDTLNGSGALETTKGDPKKGPKSSEASSEKNTETRGGDEDKKPNGSEIASNQEDGVGKETTDWVNERAVTLARAIQILGLLWADISPPPGEDRDLPRKKKTSKKSEAAQARRTLRKEKKEMLLARCIGLFSGLGWSNPVLVCQIATNGLSVRGCSMTDEAFKGHLGQDIRSRNERKNTLFSVNGIAHYLCGVLRPKTRSLLNDTGGSNIDHYKYDLKDTGFDFLDEIYAFDLILPYAMALISLSDTTLLMAGILLLRAFLSRLPNSCFDTYEEALRLRFGVNILGREANVLGLALHLVKAIASCDDPNHREVAYRTLRELLNKCSHPAVRYTISECIFQESKRMAVTAQLVTNMKDVIRFSDDVAAKGTRKDWGMAQASGLRTRFVEVCLPKYFLPQRSLLSCISPMVSTSNVCLFLAASDSRLLTVHAKDEKLSEHIKHRRRFMKAYCRLGMECVRALASVAEHDQKNVPRTRLTKENRNEAMALFAASEQTLNQSIAAICALSSALELL